jgi:hypothetical protein
MNPIDHPPFQELDIKQRIDYYEQALKNISPPSCFREQVLHNVYHCLLTNCYESRISPREDGGSRAGKTRIAGSWIQNDPRVYFRPRKQWSLLIHRVTHKIVSD